MRRDYYVRSACIPGTYIYVPVIRPGPAGSRTLEFKVKVLVKLFTGK